MARINIDDDLWTDPRFIALTRLLGDDRALSQLIRFWRCAQNFWLQERRGIPDDIFELHDFPEELFKIRLAERRDGAVFDPDAEARFAWILACQENGKKGGRKPKPNNINGERKPPGTPGLTPCPPSSNPLTLSPAPTLSLFSKDEEEKKKLNTSPPASQASPAGPTPEQQLCREIWAAYEAAYRAKYNTAPVRNATVNSQVKALAKRLGQDAIEVVKFYVRSSAEFYARKCHPMGNCLSDAETLHTQWATGIAPRGPQAFKTAAEKKTENLHNLAAKYIRPPQHGGTDGNQ